MENKNGLSYGWSLLIGLAFPILQVAIYYFRFGQTNLHAPALDYVLFFVAGALGGFVFIALLRFSRTRLARWIVVIAFLLATPLAIIGSLGGGLFGPVGVIVAPGLIWAVFTGIGFGIGWLFSKGKG